MSDTKKIILFDLPSQPPCRCWSLNPWKTRLLLNYKGLDYVTKWTEYPDLKPKLQKFFPEGQKDFTSPTIRLADGVTYVMDSKNIAERIEADHPTPSIHLDSPYIDRVIELVASVHEPLRPASMPPIPGRLLNEESATYFRETRKQRFGMPLDELHKGAPTAWDNSRAPLEKITAMLQENSEGPFFMGKTVTYADFIWIGFLLFIQRIGDDVFSNLLEATGNGQVHVALLEAAKPWTSRDSY